MQNRIKATHTRCGFFGLGELKITPTHPFKKIRGQFRTSPGPRADARLNKLHDAEAACELPAEKGRG